MSVFALSSYLSVAVPILASSMEAHFGLTPGQLGLILSLGMLGGVAGSCVGGPLADRWGRLTTLRAATSVTVAGMLLVAAGGYAAHVLRLGLVLAGFGCGAIWTAAAGLMASLFPGRRRAGFSALMVPHAIAGSLLPFVVAFVDGLHGAGRLSFQSVLLIPFAAVSALLALLALALPALRDAVPSAPASHDGPARQDARGIGTRPFIAGVAVVVLLATIHGTSDTVIYSWITRFLMSSYTEAERAFPAGWVLSFYSIAYVLGRGALVLLPDRVAPRALICLPGLIAGPLLLVALRTPSFTMAVAGYVVASFLYGLEYPALMGFAAQRYPERFSTIVGICGVFGTASAAAVWAAGRWTEAVGSMVPPLSAAGSGFAMFALIAMVWLLTKNSGGPPRGAPTPDRGPPRPGRPPQRP